MIQAPAIPRPWPQRNSVAVAGRAPMVGPGKGSGASGGGGFPSLAGLAARYRADQGVTKDGGDQVSALGDLSGNGRHLTEATNFPTWFPNLVNGMPAVHFDGANDKLSTTFSGIAAPQTLIVVAKYVSNSSGALVTLGSGSGAGADLLQTGSTKIQLEKNSVTGTDVTIPTSYFTAIAVADATVSSVQINNGPINTAITAISGNATEVTLGGRTSGQFANVEIAEFAFMAGIISASERAALLTYLQQTYGLW